MKSLTFLYSFKNAFYLLKKLQFQQVVFLILIGGIDFFNSLNSDWWKHDSAGISAKNSRFSTLKFPYQGP
jgi:hypothetical protein